MLPIPRAIAGEKAARDRIAREVERACPEILSRATSRRAALRSVASPKSRFAPMERSSVRKLAKAGRMLPFGVATGAVSLRGRIATLALRHQRDTSYVKEQRVGRRDVNRRASPAAGENRIVLDDDRIGDRRRLRAQSRWTVRVGSVPYRRPQASETEATRSYRAHSGHCWRSATSTAHDRRRSLIELRLHHRGRSNAREPLTTDHEDRLASWNSAVGAARRCWIAATNGPIARRSLVYDIFDSPLTDGRLATSSNRRHIHGTTQPPPC